MVEEEKSEQEIIFLALEKAKKAFEEEIEKYNWDIIPPIHFESWTLYWGDRKLKEKIVLENKSLWRTKELE